LYNIVKYLAAGTGDYHEKPQPVWRVFRLRLEPATPEHNPRSIAVGGNVWYMNIR
jgi:hypothetical protein